MSAETNILRHELAEARRKLDAERVNTDNAYAQLAAALRLLAEIVHESTPMRLPRDDKFYGVSAPSKETLERARAYLATNGGKK